MSGSKNPHLEESAWGWQIEAQGLKYLLKEFYGRYGIPLMVVENGFGAQDTQEADGSIHDDYRIYYHEKHIEAIVLIQKLVEELIALHRI